MEVVEHLANFLDAPSQIPPTPRAPTSPTMSYPSTPNFQSIPNTPRTPPAPFESLQVLSLDEGGPLEAADRKEGDTKEVDAERESTKDNGSGIGSENLPADPTPPPPKETDKLHGANGEVSTNPFANHTSGLPNVESSNPFDDGSSSQSSPTATCTQESSTPLEGKGVNGNPFDEKESGEGKSVNGNPFDEKESSTVEDEKSLSNKTNPLNESSGSGENEVYASTASSTTTSPDHSPAPAHPHPNPNFKLTLRPIDINLGGSDGLVPGETIEPGEDEVKNNQLSIMEEAKSALTWINQIIETNRTLTITTKIQALKVSSHYYWLSILAFHRLQPILCTCICLLPVLSQSVSYLYFAFD